MENNIKACKKCGGAKFRKHGVELCITGKKQRYQCVDCGTHYTGELIKAYEPVKIAPPVIEKPVEAYSKEKPLKVKAAK